ncbi:hypothetical protein LLH03_04570 [bacterium]|nr:hypothetical protein [bacterium]
MDRSRLQILAGCTRLYARSKGLTLITQGILFTIGIIPLLFVLRVAGLVPPVETAGMYVLGGAFFLFCVWLALRMAPGAVEKVYYEQVGNACATPRRTPLWARVVGPACILLPIIMAATGHVDSWQASVIGLTVFGLYLYIVGRYSLREPGTEIIGSTTVLLGGILAAAPQLVFQGGALPVAPEIASAFYAQSAAVTISVWLLVAWLVAAVALHAYNRWLLVEMRRHAREAGER